MLWAKKENAFINKQCFAKAAKVQPTGEPLDWMSNPRPEKWKLNGRVVGFDWGENIKTMLLRGGTTKQSHAIQSEKKIMNMPDRLK